jgi:hypothetical protein
MNEHLKPFIVRRTISQAHLETVLADQTFNRHRLQHYLREWLLEGATVEPGPILAYIRRVRCHSKFDGSTWEAIQLILKRRGPRIVA